MSQGIKSECSEKESAHFSDSFRSLEFMQQI